jgi:hypothetical protein
VTSVFSAKDHLAAFFGIWRASQFQIAQKRVMPGWMNSRVGSPQQAMTQFLGRSLFVVTLARGRRFLRDPPRTPPLLFVAPT